MRRSFVMCVLMMTLALTACGGAGEGDEAQQLLLTHRAAWLAAGGYEAALTLTADYGQRVYTYGLEVTAGEEETVLTVTSPEEAAGITARLSGLDSRLEYDGAILETGPLDDQGLSPLSALPALAEDARSGFVRGAALEALGERQTLHLTCGDPEGELGQGRQSELWLDAQTGQLVRGEILVDGYRVILCEFARFTLK